MNNLNENKSDLVSVILEDHDLLDAFADSLKIDDEIEKGFSLSAIQVKSISRFQKIRCYLWKKAKDVMSFLSNKISVLAVLAEYNFKEEERRIQMEMKKD